MEYDIDPPNKLIGNYGYIDNPTEEDIRNSGEDLGQAPYCRDPKWGLPIRIGKLTIVDRVNKRDMANIDYYQGVTGNYKLFRNGIYNLKCDCGNFIRASRIEIREAIKGKGTLYSCGCVKKPVPEIVTRAADLTGIQYGRLVPERFAGANVGWVCLCLDCAVTLVINRLPTMSYRVAIHLAGRQKCQNPCVSEVIVPPPAPKPEPEYVESIPEPYDREKDTFAFCAGNPDWDLVEEPEYSGNYVYVHKETGERRAIEW